MLIFLLLSAWAAAVTVAPAQTSGRSRGKGPIRPYITDVHTGNKPADRATSTNSTMFAVERSNAGASIHDLKPEKSLDVEVEPPRVVPREIAEPIPELPSPVSPDTPMDDLPYEGELIEGENPSDWPIPSQVHETRIPAFDDGLAGNRQVALTPFPNLNIQSGPLATHQLPWSHKFRETKPFSVATTMEFQTMAGFLKNNGGGSEDYGWYNSFLFSVPFWREKGVGVQFAATAEPTTEPQLLVEFGFAAFRRAVWPEDPGQRILLFDRLSWGVGFDGIWDTENRIFVGQQRMEAAYSVGPNRELGLWGAFSLGEELSTVKDYPINFSTSAHFAFYYRHVFPSELDGTIFVGATENPGGFLFGAYMSYRMTARTAWVLQGMNNFGQDAGNSLYMGLRVYFSPLVDTTNLSGTAMNRYRAFMRPPDHINLQLRETPP